jgi:hypothetical protein
MNRRTHRSDPTDSASEPSAAKVLGLWPFLVFVIGVVAIWLPPRPPMIDLPQFAGQIGLLDGLIKGTSPWSHVVRVDALTPYLIAYVLTVPLSLFLPVVVALKIVLSAALAGFGLAAAAIRRELGATRALDAYSLVGFFGFDYACGFCTFLVAAPLGLLLIWLSLRYARSPSPGRGLTVGAAGIVLLFSHGLVFLFATGLSVILVVVRSGPTKKVLQRMWPFAAPLAGLVFFAYLLGGHVRGVNGGPLIFFGSLDQRLLGVFAAVDDRPEFWVRVAIVALLALPFLVGLSIDTRRPERLIIVGAVFGAIALAPDWVWSAWGIFRRFGIFAPAAYAWLFSDRDKSAGGLSRIMRPHLSLAASVLAGLILAKHVLQAAEFSREASDFDAVMRMARPGNRALSLVLDPASAADVDLYVYVHFPFWYQAERNGLVDPSFAAGPPSVVRYRLNPPGIYNEVLSGVWASHFDWRRDHGEQWTYFFVRHAAPVPAGLFAGAPCPPMLAAARGAWSLFEARACGAPPS